MKNILVVCLIALLSACAGNMPQTLVSKSPATAKRSQPLFGPVVVYVTASRDVQLDSDWSALMQAWQAAFAKAAAAERMSVVFVIDEASAPLSAAALVRIMVKDFYYVSSLKHSMLGALSGRAGMDIDVDFIDAVRNKSFSHQAINTAANGGGDFAADMPKQSLQVAQMIVQEVLAKAPVR